MDTLSGEASPIKSPAHPLPSTEVVAEATTNAGMIIPQGCGCGGGSCDCASTSAAVYVAGTLQPFFPSLDLRKEFEGAAKMLNLEGDQYARVFNYKDDGGGFLSNRPFLYIAEQVRWVFSIDSVDTYILVPRSAEQLETFIAAITPQVPVVKTVVIGERQGKSPPGYCGHLQLPIVFPALLANANEKTLGTAALKSNDGSTDIDRAVNFIAFGPVQVISDELEQEIQRKKELKLQRIEAHIIDPVADRIIVKVIFEYQNSAWSSQVSYYCDVDVTNDFPFVVTPMSLYAQ